MRDSSHNMPAGFLTDVLLLGELPYVQEKLISGSSEDCFTILNSVFNSIKRKAAIFHQLNVLCLQITQIFWLIQTKLISIQTVHELSANEFSWKKGGF